MCTMLCTKIWTTWLFCGIWYTHAKNVSLGFNVSYVFISIYKNGPEPLITRRSLVRIQPPLLLENKGLALIRESFINLLLKSAKHILRYHHLTLSNLITTNGIRHEKDLQVDKCKCLRRNALNNRRRWDSNPRITVLQTVALVHLATPP